MFLFCSQAQHCTQNQEHGKRALLSVACLYACLLASLLSPSIHQCINLSMRPLPHPPTPTRPLSRSLSLSHSQSLIHPPTHPPTHSLTHALMCLPLESGMYSLSSSIYEVLLLQSVYQLISMISFKSQLNHAPIKQKRTATEHLCNFKSLVNPNS